MLNGEVVKQSSNNLRSFSMKKLFAPPICQGSNESPEPNTGGDGADDSNAGDYGSPAE